MFRLNTRATIVALTAIAALALPASALATNVTRWTIAQSITAPNGVVYDYGDSDVAPFAGLPTCLFDNYREANMTLPTGVQVPEPEYLSYGHETFGVDLTWSPSIYGASCGGAWEFIRQPGHYLTQQIPAGERVALYNTVNNRYLARACPSGTGCIGAGEELFGINLYWSQTAQYEWQVFKGGDDGHPFYADLYNAIEKAYLIDHGQTFGVDLGWIHAPFETGPDYIPPKLAVTTTQQGNVAPPLPIKG